ncbi:DUF2690 domain-containing protein [Micromonospora sp. RP3T]|uniref:DUF2690 domain-containing protein n=1 Tax=Micromonospora sp. RP3T TaxID=2135446 RepID=UPI000D16DCB7|nr:DUF2690 domain-containing protein [Micromonospora sp. RP3T]PTA42904.1 hypothetical protein C8054_28180 [Micromonospora sp. RP3T]
MRTRIHTLVVATLIAFAGTSVASAAPAQAAYCDGAGCFGKNPEGNCTGGIVDDLLSREYKVDQKASFRITLRYSRVCRAGWMRLTVYPGIGSQSYSGSAWNPNGPSVGFAGHLAPNTWTYMIDATPGHSVCGGTHLSIDGVYKGWYDPGCVTR